MGELTLIPGGKSREHYVTHKVQRFQRQELRVCISIESLTDTEPKGEKAGKEVMVPRRKYSRASRKAECVSP